MTKRCIFTTLPLWLTLTPWLALPIAAQETRPLALVNARILTMTGADTADGSATAADAGVIERGTIVVRDGRIDAVGAGIPVPPGARVVDVAGGTVMPGLVHAWSRAGADDSPSAGPSMAGPPTRGRRSRQPRSGGGGSSNAVVKAASKIADELYARQDVFGELLREGVTTLVVRPDATGFPGLAARVAPNAGPDVALTVADEVYLVVSPAPSPAAGKQMKDALDKAQKVLEERKKPKEEPKPEPAKDGEKPGEKGEAKGEATPKPEEKPAPAKEGETPKEGEKPVQDPKKDAAAEPAKKPEPPKDPNIEILADLLDGKRKAFLRLSSAMEIQHYRGAIGEHAFPSVVIADQVDPRRGLPTLELDWLKKSAAIVLTSPSLTQLPNTRVLTNPPAELAAAGLKVGFVLPDDPRRLRGLMFELMELVRCGLPADVALRAVTAVPAAALGLESEVGTIAAGLRADLLVFSGDPLDPTSRLRTVFLEGHEVEAHANR